MENIKFKLNGLEETYSGRADTRLIDALRGDFGLTGVKEGCGEGECGACMVLVDGAPVLSCLALMGQMAGRSVTTIEKLRECEGFVKLEDAFAEEGAIQCGFCTPGMLTAAYALLSQNSSPTQAEIKTAMAGNICRCTGYASIIRAVAAASKVWETK